MPTCEKCHHPFPNRETINGKVRNLSARRFCLKCSPFGENNRRDLTQYGEGTRICGSCGRTLLLAEFYERRTRGEYAVHSSCKSCLKDRQLGVFRQTKREFVAYKGGNCSRCGYSRNIAALDFHHRDPSKKEFKLSRFRYGLTAKVKRELDACDLLCANCHREVHNPDHAVAPSSSG